LNQEEIMKSLRQAIQKSWIPEMKIINRDIAIALQLPQPLSLTDFTRFFDKPETLVFDQPIHSTGLRGRVELILQSDGSYIFRGHMRAIDWSSYAYKIQVFVRSAGVMIALETSGHVFGTDTPGDRQREWNETGSYNDVRKFWAALRINPQFEVLQDHEIAGVTGTLADVAQAALETFVAAYAGGTVGALIVLGAAGVTVKNPNILLGITVGAGVYLAFGSGFIIPALAAGTATASLADIRHRSLNGQEIQLADLIFKGTLPVDRIVLTDLHSPDRYREFVYPAIDGSIQVNMGRNYDNPLGADVNGRSSYSKPGSVLMHELTHAWQIEHTTFIPGMMCKALIERDYSQDVETSGNSASWSSFSLEQQASIVDSWYSKFIGQGLDGSATISDWIAQGLDSSVALSDNRFKYISENIRRGQA
jgi:hypothetical protein